jgi:phenylalanyl-tRNA synthetase beta chain
MLRRCYFEVEVNGEDMIVTVPAFRLDIEIDSDLIEEVGRIYGYHNIEPQPVKMYAPYVENPINKNAWMLRDMMVGHGFIEVLTYGFIAQDSMKKLNIPESSPYYGEVHILNPLASWFELMRPTLAYNLIETAISNLTAGKNDIKIFELGKTFTKKKGAENPYDNYVEKNMFAALFTGARVTRGFGAGKEIKYSVYDAVALVRSLLGEYNLPIEIKNNDSFGMFEPGAAAEITVGGKHIGVVGKIAKNVLNSFENGKLAKDDVLYLEFSYGDLVATKKSISYETNFPSIVREYNFIVKNGIHFCDYSTLITEASPFVVSVKPVDIYFGTGVAKGSSAVLINVEYNARTRTLAADEIEAIEHSFKNKLMEKYGIELKA